MNYFRTEVRNRGRLRRSRARTRQQRVERVAELAARLARRGQGHELLSVDRAVTWRDGA